MGSRDPDGSSDYKLRAFEQSLKLKGRVSNRKKIDNEYLIYLGGESHGS